MSTPAILVREQPEAATEIRTAARHAFVYSFGGILAKGIAFCLLPFYSHYLRPAEYGIIELLDLAMSVLGMFLNMGLSAAFLRYYNAAEDEEEKRRVLGTSFLFVTLAGTVLFVAGTLLRSRAAALLFGPKVPPVYFELSFSLFILAYVAIIPYTCLRAREASGTLTILDSAGVLSMLVMNVYFIAVLKLSVMGVLISQLIVGFLKAVYLVAAIRGRARASIDWALLRRILSFGTPLVLSNGTLFILNFSDRFFLERFRSLDVVGLYAMGYKFPYMLNFLLIQPFMMMWEARMYLLYRRPDHREVFQQVFLLYSLLLIWCGLGIVLFGEQVITTLIGRNFRAAQMVVAPVALAYVFLGLGYFFQTGLYVTSRTALLGLLSAVAAVVNLGANLELIRSFGMRGAAWSTTIGFLVLAVGSYLCSQRVFPLRLGISRVSIAGLLAAGLYFLSRFLPHSMWSGLGVRAGLFGGFPLLLWLARIIPAGEIQTIQSLAGGVLEGACRWRVRVPRREKLP